MEIKIQGHGQLLKNKEGPPNVLMKAVVSYPCLFRLQLGKHLVSTH